MIDIVNDNISNVRKPHVVVLLDESGSMSSQRMSVVDTFNEYVNSVKETASTISLYTFDSKGIREKFYMVGIGNVPKLKIDNYKPDGMTPLYDAMGKIINKFEDVDGTVQFVVHTDGIENNSCEFNFLRLEDYIKQMTDKGWLFVYLGEGVDGKNEMAKFRGVKVNFSSQNRMQSIGELSKTTAYYSAGVGNDVTNYSNNIDGSIDVDTGETVK